MEKFLKDREIYLSTGAFEESDLGVILETARQNSFAHIELSSSVPYNVNNIETVRNHTEDLTFLVHNYFPAPAEPFVLNLASDDDANLDRSRSHCKGAIELAAELGAPFYSAHAGFAAALNVEHLGMPFDGVKAVPHDIAYSIFRQSVIGLIEHAEKHGIAFYIENNVVAPFNARDGENDLLLLCDPDELLKFYADINHPNFGFLIDVGHLSVSAKTLGFDRDAAMDSLVPYVRAFHLSDNNMLADTNELFDEDAWFLPWLRKCPEAKIVIEVYTISPDKIRHCIETIKKWI